MTPPTEGRGGGARQSAAPAATPSGFISRYQILDKIGEGGMGSLFLARDPAIDRLVAIKLLRRGFDTPELRDRFAREARAAGRLRHPNIVTIFDVGEHDGDPFIAMEFLAGETLHELIQAQARLSLARRLKLLEELCDGLAYAHRAGIVHRDIKPANLLVDSEGVLKILDFGIVRLDEGGATQSGVLVGTLNYMSPEQVAGGPIDRRSDIFSVGLVAYELLSGRQGFPGTLRDGLLNRIITAAIEPLGNIRPSLDPEVAAIVDRALEPSPDQRYPDLSNMRNDLIRVRKRIEAIEEAEADHSEADGGETMVVTRPGVPTPLSGIPADDPAPSSERTTGVRPGVEAAERALKAGEYRVALTLAGRSAAANPDDQSAAHIMARAQAALLERGRALATGALLQAGAAGSKAAAPAPVAVPPVFPRAKLMPLYIGAAAVLILAVAMTAWISLGTKPEGSGAVPAEPSIAAPASAPVTTATGAAEPAQEPATTVIPPPPVTGTPEPPPPPAAGAARERPSTPAAVTPPRLLVVGKDVPAPRRIRYVEPVYPESAAGAEGNVGIELTIGRDGRVADARVTRSIAGLDQAAVAAVRQWEFAPVVVRGAAVPVIYPVSVGFSAPVVPEAAPAKPAVTEVKPPPAPPPSTPVAAAPAPAKPAGPPPVDLRAEEKAVRQVLQDYRSAWESRDADAVARVQRLSSDALRQVRNTLESAEAYRMALDVQSVVVEPDGQRAHARASIVRTYTPRVGSTMKIPAATSTFTLEKRDGRWVITGIK
jgi:serine/threonine-protein kinase